MKRRGLAVLLAAVLGASMLAGCGNSEDGSSGGKKKVRLMVWSPSEDQSKDSGEWLQTTCEKFADEHPEWDITFVYGVADEATAAGQVAQDPEASADVFMYANDTLTTMTDANALVKFGGKYREEIERTNTEEVISSLTKNGELYGVPFTTNTWFMYYDKSVFDEEDVKNLDTMLEKGVDFGGEKSVEVTDYLVDLAGNPNFKIDADGSGIAGLRDGSISAMFSGSWDANAVKEALGDNMGAIALPAYTLNGEEKQMMAYAGSKAIGVNPNCKDMVAAVELAVYLGSAEAQRTHYELRNVIPCNTELLKDTKIAEDPLVMAQNNTFNDTSILQPFVAKMNNCWTPVENMGKGIRNGSVTHDNAAEQAEAMNEAMNSDGI